ncbi:hypothetical protein QOZ80_2BG0201940 [Eleusine coracana subsp. coracana]|nr:hypothetical protein QOZ80_2BG0201940 [Eleusine coracana subsp. coracana]
MVMGNKANKQSKQAEGAKCRRHPRHRQPGAGVCAICLQERLSRLSISAPLPSVCGGVEDEERASSSCSEASTAYSSEGSTGCSSAAAEGASSGSFHDEMRRSGRRVSLLMKHERVVGDADAVAAFLQARREQRRRTTAATSFWAKLLNAATRGGGAKARRQEDEDGCSLAHSKASTLQERVAAAKWVLF